MTPTLLLGLLGGAFFAHRATKPVREVVATARAIIDTGNLSARVPASARQTELADLARQFNRVLDKNQALIQTMREAFRKGNPAADVPVGLLHTVVKLADSPKMTAHEWKQIVRCIFAAYPRSERFWKEKFLDVLPDPSLGGENNAESWLESILSNWNARIAKTSYGRGKSVSPPTKAEREEWVERVTRNPSLCSSPELENLLGRYRSYTSATGDSEYLVKTFNNLANRVSGRDASKIGWAVSLLNECIQWQPYNPYNYTVISRVLWAANRRRDAIDNLWNARLRFPGNPVVRNELGKRLREAGDLAAALGVFRRL